MKKYLQLLLSSLLLFFITVVNAHDPGSSKAWITVHSNEVRIVQSFNPMELNVVVGMDADSDGAVDAFEFSQKLKELEVIASDSLGVVLEDGILNRKSLQLSIEPDSAIIFDIRYRVSNLDPTTITFNMVSRLARGHRMFATVQDGSGSVLAQHILSANSAVIEVDGAKQSLFDVVTDFFYEGVWHIWIGADHILFLLTLLLPTVLIRTNKSWMANDNLRSSVIDVLRIVTAFTVAHSITLSLAIFEIVVIPINIVETVIAISVFFAAINNLWPMFRQARWLMAFLFGLIHGFGFASVLSELSLPDENLLSTLLSFNLGVEAGQLAIVAVVFPIMAILRCRPFYSTWILQGGSAAVAVMAVIWGLQRSGVMAVWELFFEV